MRCPCFERRSGSMLGDMSRRHTSAVQIRRQNRKSFLMRITPAGRVVVYVPHWLPVDHPRVMTFIEHGLEQLAAHLPGQGRPQQHDAAAIRRLVAEWAARLEVQPGRVQLREMSKKWGSCSGRGNITLNTALCWLPYHLVEYIVVHELAHMRVFHHGPEFWEIVAQHIPDYEERERELNNYPV
jgi:predicted metal-dependent hydrolase